MPEKLPRSRTWLPCLALAGALAGLFAGVAPFYVRRYGLPLPSAAGIYGCFVLLLVMVVIPGMRGSRQWIAAHLIGRRLPAILIFVWCAPYLLYAAGAHDFRWTALARLCIVSTFLPLLYSFFPVSTLNRFSWQDLLVALWLIAVLLTHQLRGIWNSPANLDFMGRLFLIGVSSWNWIFVRKVPDLGYQFSLSTKIVRAAALNFAWFAAIAIPAGFALHFIEWHPRRVSLLSFCLDYLEILLFIALLEELFFRGFLQTLVSRSLHSSRGGQLLISCLFGLFHILHAPFPNWRYVVLATVAGWFYGSAFLQGRSLLASSLAHAMVDTVWRTFFSKN
jgi:membrane protease YdiL (CAAX protease family)